MSELERQISWVTRASADTHRAAPRRLCPAAEPGAGGQPALAAQRRGPRDAAAVARQTVSIGSNADFSRDVRFTETRRRAASASRRPYFRDERPFMSISVAHSGFNAGVTVAEIDLAFLVRLPRRRPGRQGDLRLCRRPQRRGAGDFLERTRDRQGSLDAAAGRRRDGAGRHRARRPARDAERPCGADARRARCRSSAGTCSSSSRPRRRWRRSATSWCGSRF